MTHFHVMVIGDNYAEQLAPYHEFESTGRNDQYVINQDITTEQLTKYTSESTTRMRNIHTGALISTMNDMFFREPTLAEVAKHGPMIGSGGNKNFFYVSKDWNDGKGYRAKVLTTVPDWVEVSVPYKDIFSFKDYLENDGHSNFVFDEATVDIDGDEKYGYVVLNNDQSVVKVVRRTNPNRKWDWYEVGGRFDGWLLTKEGTRTNQVMVGAIDWYAMQVSAAKHARDYWEKVKKAAPNFWTSWDEIMKRFPDDISKARDVYHGQPGRKALHNTKGLFWADDDLLVSREQYMKSAYNRAGITRALLMDGKWSEKGQARMFGIFDETMSDHDWSKKVRKVIDELPATTMITIVDCHV